MKVGDLVKFRNPKPVLVENNPYMETVGVVVGWDCTHPVVWWGLLNHKKIMLKAGLELVNESR